MLRRAALGLCTAVLLAGPATIAFFTGGFFEDARLLAAVVMWAIVAVVALASPAPLPRRRAGRAALAGLSGLAAWVALSLTWAPDHGAAFQDTQRLVLYLGALIAATALLRGRRALRAIEPVLAAGGVVVIGYGLSERVLPGLVTLSRNASAGGRLHQPISYWNATGVVAAMALVLALRIAGDKTRGDRLRSLASAAAVPLGLGVYLSFSRGALAAGAIGVLALVALAPSWAQLRAAVLGLEAALAAALLSSRLSAVQSLTGSLATREAQGLAMLAALGVLMLGAGAFQHWACSVERGGRTRGGPLPRPRPAVAVAVALALAAGAAVATASAGEHAGATVKGATAARFSSVGSNRYSYWKVALRTFGHNPVAGTGSGGFRVQWLRHRPFRESVKDAHSLYFETAAELGLVGLALLAAMFGGVICAARRAMRAEPATAAGLCAALSVWAVHCGLDWDWEMPAVSLLAIVLAGGLIALGERPPAQPSRA